MATKRRYNWKARLSGSQQPHHGNRGAENITVDLGRRSREEDYDECNALVLPSKRVKLKQPPPEELRPKKLLSKKQRKKLEKILERREKKENRSSLISALQDVQIPAKELQKMTSLAEIQTKGLKKIFAEQASAGRPGKIRSLKGQGKLPGPDKDDDAEDEREDSEADEEDSGIDPNVVGLDDGLSSSSSSEEDEEEEEVAQPRSAEDAESESDFEPNVVEKAKSRDGSRPRPLVTAGNWTVEPLDPIPEKRLEPVRNGDVGSGEVSAVLVVDLAEARPERKPAVHVPVYRRDEIQEARLRLPILAEEQTVMEAVNAHSVVVVAGETGSGKTTQLPQFLYEAGYAHDRFMIGVTEPRRVAAVSMAKRVGLEMNLGEDVVSYQIRYEGNATDKTRILFMTDGVLLKEVQNDFLLSRYSVIIVDEAHERSVYTDILIGLLSRIVPLREKRALSSSSPSLPPLKLVVMSATLRIQDFTENPRLFRTPPPVVSVESRQFPVTVHFNKTTPSDYVAESFRKVCKIHRRLPEGGILVFLTGQQEVNTLCRKLRRTFPARRRADWSNPNDVKSEREGEEDEEDEEMGKMLKAVKGNAKTGRRAKSAAGRRMRRKEVDSLGQNRMNLDDYEPAPFVSMLEREGDEEDGGGDDDDDDEDEADFGVEGSDEDDDEAFFEGLEDEADRSGGLKASTPLHVLPLYSLLPSSRQAKVFEPPPSGSRLCVVATNVAETSLTIPGVKYVVDCGKTKRRFYDKTTGVSAFFVVWTSQASASQRTGRAGRQGPGHCYRLYSSAVFTDEMEEFSVPEIRLRPVDDLVLRMKSMNIHRVQNFPFPTAPGKELIAAAERRLKLLGALKPQAAASTNGAANRSGGEEVLAVTPLGRTMAAFPISPRYAKMLALSRQADFPTLMLYAVAMIASFAVPEILLERPVVDGNEEGAKREEGGEASVERIQRTEMVKWTEIRRKWSGVGNSKLLGDAFILLKAVGGSDWTDHNRLEEFCVNNGIRSKALTEVRKLRIQLTNEANLLIPGLELPLNPKMKPPNDQQCKLLRQIVLSGLIDQVAVRVDSLEEFETAEERKRWKKGYRCAELVDPVFIHPASVLFEERPKLVVYQEIMETYGKMSMRGVVAIEPDWLPKFAPELCNLSDPLPEPPPAYDPESGLVKCSCTATYGKAAWALGTLRVEHPLNVDKFRHFAEALLLGSVLDVLGKYVGHLVSPPATIFKSWAKLQKRTDVLLDALMSRGVDSKQKLVSTLAEDPKYLLSAYLEWIPPELHNEIVLLWPPIPKSDSSDEEEDGREERDKKKRRTKKKPRWRR